MIFKNEQKLVPFNECEAAPETLTSVSEYEAPLPLPLPISHMKDYQQQRKILVK
jgi:hypothetical protein